MHLYLTIAHRTGSAEALELAEELSAWHDEMVIHARVVALRGPEACGDSCPHIRAVELWRAAREVLGEGAESLEFLRAAATESRAEGLVPSGAGQERKQPLVPVPRDMPWLP